jgi:hypothetical protein
MAGCYIKITVRLQITTCFYLFFIHCLNQLFAGDFQMAAQLRFVNCAKGRLHIPSDGGAGDILNKTIFKGVGFK